MTEYAGVPVFPAFFVDPEGDPQESVSITVYNRGTVVKPTLYTNKTKSATVANPFTADSLGNAFPYLNPGDYDAVANGVTVPFSVVPDLTETVDTSTNFDHWTFGSGRPWVDPRNKQGTSYGARGDGVSRPLSTLYGTLVSAQIDFPQATALTDELDAVALLRAQAISPKIRIDDGVFVVNRSINYHTAGYTQGIAMEGAGREETIFDSRVANGAALRFDGSGSGVSPDTYKSQYGTELSNFKITTTLVGGARPALSNGIEIKAGFFGEIEFITIDGITGDAVVLDNPNGDTDSNSFIRLYMSELRRNGGSGVWCPTPTTANVGTGFIEVVMCRIDQNSGYGIRFYSQKCSVHHTAVAHNALGGIFQPYSAGVPASQFVDLYMLELEQNANFNVHLENANWPSVRKSRSIHRAASGALHEGPPVGIKIGTTGGAGLVRHAQIEDINVRADSGSAPIGVEVTNTSYYADIRRVFDLGTVPATLVSNAGVNTVWKHNGIEYGTGVAWVRSTKSGGSWTHTPNLMPSGVAGATPGGKNHFITCTTAAAGGTVANPTGLGHASFPTDGMELRLCIYNNTGGSMGTVAFGSWYKHVVGSGAGEFAVPANGFMRTALFVFDSSTSRMRISGGWSGDIPV